MRRTPPRGGRDGPFQLIREALFRKPRALRAGDRLAVVAPASNCSRDEFDRGVAEIRQLGFEPTFDASVFHRATFTAGEARTRADAFVAAWNDPDIAALIAVRGGYGSVELLPWLDAAQLGPPKLFIGYSDTTSLLTWLTIHRRLPALHGPMLDGRLSRGSEGYDRNSFLGLLSGGKGLELRPGGVRVLRAGDISGRLLGGTLTQLGASLGTPYGFDPPPGSVLFLEDVNERPYRLHRLLMQLRLAGVLSRASGIVFGEMRGCDEPDGQITAAAVIEEFAGDCSGPVIAGFPSGHTAGPCWTLPLGVTCRIITTPYPALIVEDAPVE
jgi:muramoyltetrapeptide carboxypeptidase